MVRIVQLVQYCGPDCTVGTVLWYRLNSWYCTVVRIVQLGQYCGPDCTVDTLLCYSLYSWYSTVVQIVLWELAYILPVISIVETLKMISNGGAETSVENRIRPRPNSQEENN